MNTLFLKVRNKLTSIYNKIHHYMFQTLRLGQNVRITGKDYLTFHRSVKILPNTVINATNLGDITIDKNTIIGIGSVLIGGNGIHIGKNVLIAQNCVLVAGNHNYKQTELPMLHCSDYLSKGPIIIEDDVWIGANCVITDGVTLGKGCVIGAGTVICNDVAPNKIVYTKRELVIKNRE